MKQTITYSSIKRIQYEFTQYEIQCILIDHIKQKCGSHKREKESRWLFDWNNEDTEELIIILVQKFETEQKEAPTE